MTPLALIEDFDGSKSKYYSAHHFLHQFLDVIRIFDGIFA